MDSLHFALIVVLAVSVLYFYFQEDQSRTDQPKPVKKYLNFIEIIVPGYKLEVTQIQRLIHIEAADSAATTVKEPRNWVIRYDLGGRSFAKLELDNCASVLNGTSVKFINNERAEISVSHLNEPTIYVFKPSGIGGG